MIFFFFVLAGVGWASINVNSYPMVVEMSRGSDIGRYTGYYYTTSMAAQVITPVLSGAVLEYGYLLLGSADPNAGYVFPVPIRRALCRAVVRYNAVCAPRRRKAAAGAG